MRWNAQQLRGDARRQAEGDHGHQRHRQGGHDPLEWASPCQSQQPWRSCLGQTLWWEGQVLVTLYLPVFSLNFTGGTLSQWEATWTQ